MREIARMAAVDTALVHHYFATKRGLFEEALRTEALGRGPATQLDLADENAGEDLVRAFLETWDTPAAAAQIAGLLRTAGSDSAAQTLIGDLIWRTIVAPAIAEIDAKRGMPKLRAALVGAQLAGLAWLRYVLRIQPLASASAQILGRTYGPSIDATLRGVDYR